MVSLPEKTRIHHLGLMTIDTIFGNYGEIGLRRTIFSVQRKILWSLRNTLLRTARPKQSLSKWKILKKLSVQVLPAASVGVYVISSEVLLPHTKRINPGDTADFALAFAGREAGTGPLRIDPAAEERVRKERVDDFLAALQLRTPDPVLNTAFGLAKIRAVESIYQTKGGLMHGSGGGLRNHLGQRSDRVRQVPSFHSLVTAQQMRRPSTNYVCSLAT